jgi:Protein of unknown function (DUF4238)
LTKIVKELSKSSHRHHFIPEFYLKAWYPSKNSGFWVYTKNRRGMTVARQNKYARSYCFVKDLYLLKPDGGNLISHESDKIEKEFFLWIDTKASEIHSRLICRGLSALSGDDKFYWAIFVFCLIQRSPETIQEFVAQMKQKLFNLEQFIRNSYLSNLPNMILGTGAVEYIANMKWSIVKIPDHMQEHYLLGDNPLLAMPEENDEAIQVISMPISPRQLLVMTIHDQDFDEEFSKYLSLFYNFNVMKQSQKYIISSKKLENEAHFKYQKTLDLWGVSNLNSTLFG